MFHRHWGIHSEGVPIGTNHEVYTSAGPATGISKWGEQIKNFTRSIYFFCNMPCFEKPHLQEGVFKTSLQLLHGRVKEVGCPWKMSSIQGEWPAGSFLFHS